MPVTLVTGCSSGFGLLTALRFARGGHTVVATMRDTSKAGDLERARDGEDLDLHIEALDVTDDTSVREAVARVTDRHGAIDVLVNNAGIGIDGAVEEVSDEEVARVFETNVFGVVRATRAVLPGMRERGRGVVVNVSSLAGRVSPPFGGLYSASKWALEAISEALHYEVGPFGIRVHVIEPGGFPTRFNDNRLRAEGPGSPYDDLRRRWEEAYARLPGRDGEPADPSLVADAIWEVAIDASQPLRRLVGADAETVGALRDQLGDREFEHTIRSGLDFWDGWRER